MLGSGPHYGYRADSDPGQDHGRAGPPCFHAPGPDAAALQPPALIIPAGRQFGAARRGGADQDGLLARAGKRPRDGHETAGGPAGGTAGIGRRSRETVRVP